jgi:hypothetical protein
MMCQLRLGGLVHRCSSLICIIEIVHVSSLCPSVRPGQPLYGQSQVLVEKRYICTFIRLHMSEISWFVPDCSLPCVQLACVMQGGGCFSVVLLPSAIQWLSRSFLSVLRYQSLYYIVQTVKRTSIQVSMDLSLIAPLYHKMIILHL